MFNSKKKLASALHQEAQYLSADGQEEGAIAKYLQAIACDPGKSASHYNLGLIYKYRGDWANALAYSRRASQLDPEDEAARWNLAIAATALRDWEGARQAWADCGIKLDGTSGPIEMNFGITPVRLDPAGRGEVVWARRIDPVRARIGSIPFAESGYCFGDIVLHDGAPAGYRMYGERECPVFNVLALFSRSGRSTFELNIEIADAAKLEALMAAFSAADIDCEDWTSNVRMLCKACSEGLPHTDHDNDSLVATPDQWQPSRRLAMAGVEEEGVHAAIRQWQGETPTPYRLSCILNATGFDQNI